MCVLDVYLFLLGGLILVLLFLFRIVFAGTESSGSRKVTGSNGQRVNFVIELCY